VQLGQHALASLGYEVETSTQPATALALVRSDPHRFDLVITDQTMPQMTGLALAMELRKIRPDLPVILVTGYSHSLTPRGVEAAGLRQLLLKPFTIQSLGEAVSAALHAQSPR
jgi:CheY-like chemotaxis protein